MTSCGRGWGHRCPGSAGKKCRCSCGGERHGIYRRARDLREPVEPLMPVGTEGHPQLDLLLVEG